MENQDKNWVFACKQQKKKEKKMFIIVFFFWFIVIIAKPDQVSFYVNLNM